MGSQWFCCFFSIPSTHFLVHANCQVHLFSPVLLFTPGTAAFTMRPPLPFFFTIIFTFNIITPLSWQHEYSPALMDLNGCTSLRQSTNSANSLEANNEGQGWSQDNFTWPHKTVLCRVTTTTNTGQPQEPLIREAGLPYFWMTVLQFVYPFTHYYISGLFPVLGLYEEFYRKYLYTILCGQTFLFLLDRYWRLDLLCHTICRDTSRASACLTSQKLGDCSPEWRHHFGFSPALSNCTDYTSPLSTLALSAF